jgi:RHH-type proline utilization regulon transcriptional repressor/proline dehydrogenase/delta 1-pyrroline-5-carboxylate dehydrogenase
MIAHKDVGGVAFTGSTEVAKQINLTLAQKAVKHNTPIVPLIAETGGQNAMIIDSSALTEQVIDDVLLGAFGSAGQRCSATRILCVQDDVADGVIDMLRGALELRRVGDPFALSTDIGPVIDEEALASLKKHQKRLEKIGKFISHAPLDEETMKKGTFFAPVAYEIKDISKLEGEVFGPVLHVVRYKAKHLDKLLQQINDTGYGLTFGVHSRISSSIDHMSEAAHVGNVYVNRGMTGAVVGVQPFGGHGLSGTGPKAGGPHYLPRFAVEKVISTDTTRQGGNATLVSLTE